MLERTGQRLRHLNRKPGLRVVWQAVILPAPIGVLRLQKQIGARHHSRAVDRRQSLANSGFVVMPPLVRCIDAAESRANRQFGEGCSSVLLPSRAIQEVGNAGKERANGRMGESARDGTEESEFSNQ